MGIYRSWMGSRKTGNGRENYLKLKYTTYLASFRSTSKGGLVMTLLLLVRPINRTNKTIPGKRIRKGTLEGTKGASNNHMAISWLLSRDNRIPERLPRIPRYKYS